jgi:hydrogenase-4 component F
MAMLIYICVGVLLAIACFLRIASWLRITAIWLFLGIQTTLTLFGFFHTGETQLLYFTFDHTGLIFLSILTFLSFYTVYYSFSYLKKTGSLKNRQGVYFGALIMLSVSMTGVYLANNAGLLWVLIEATTLAVSLLIYHERSALSLEATWKYLFVCSVGAALAFVGILFLGMLLDKAGSQDLSFGLFPLSLKIADPLWLKIIFLFILVGFSTKMGLFPMQTITVDAHTVAPPPISAFISTALMNVGFVAVFRFFSAFSGKIIFPWMKDLLLWTGILSVAVSAIYLLSASHLKRMSAYSSLEHMGLAAIGLSVGGIGMYAVFLHLILHSLNKAGLFYQLGLLHESYGTYSIKKLGNYFGSQPMAGISLFFLLIFLSAIPPSGLFVTEFMILAGLFNTGKWIPFVLVLLLMTFIIFSLVRTGINVTFSEPGPEDVKPLRNSVQKLIPIFILMLMIIVLGFFTPPPVTEFIRQAVKLIH